MTVNEKMLDAILHNLWYSLEYKYSKGEKVDAVVIGIDLLRYMETHTDAIVQHGKTSFKTIFGIKVEMCTSEPYKLCIAQYTNVQIDLGKVGNV